MKLISILVNAVGGTGIFVGAGAGWLAMQGRLTTAEIARVPGLSFLRTNEQPPPPETPGGLPPAGPDGATGAGAAPAGAGAGTAATGAGTGAPPPPSPGVKTPGGPAPITISENLTTTDLNEMLRASGQARSDYETRMAGLEERERALAQASRDLEARRRELEDIMAKVTETQTAMSASRARFDKDVVKLKESEQANVKRLAGLYEGMAEPAAAAALAELDPQTAAKVLSAMQKRKAGKVLGAMPPALAADLSARMSKFIDDRESAPVEPGEK